MEGGVHMPFSHLFVTTNTKRIAHDFLEVLLKLKDTFSSQWLFKAQGFLTPWPLKAPRTSFLKIFNL